MLFRSVNKHHRKWFTPGELYITLCETSMPIKQKLSALLTNQNGHKLFEGLKQVLITEKNWRFTFLALYSAGRYVDALNILEQQCDDRGFSDPSSVLKRYESDEGDFGQQNIPGIITDLLLRCSRYHDALVFASHAYDTISDEKSKLRLAEIGRASCRERV